MRDTRSLNRDEQRALDRMAETSDFWSRIRASAAEYDGLTQKQYEIFLSQIKRDAWKATAQRVGGVPVKNKFRTGGRKPRCANRAKPYCENEGTVVVGAYAYCPEHADAARDSLDDWLAARDAERRQSQPTDDTEPSSSQSRSRIEAYLDGDDFTSIDAPY